MIRFFLVKRQLIWAALGGAAALVVSLTPLEMFRRALPLILLATLVAAVLPFLPRIGTSVLGSRRWVTVLGMSFQPSEIVKVTLILYLASYFARREESESMPLNTLIPPFIVVCVFAAIVLLQNDYSTAIFLVATGLSMLFVAKVRTLHFLLMTLFTGTLGFLLLFTREHRVQRLLAYFDLSSYRSGTGYQILNAKAALVSGGLWARGLGRSVAKLGALPMAHSDFIYSIIGEETGLLGALFVLMLFAFLAWRGSRSVFGRRTASARTPPSASRRPFPCRLFSTWPSPSGLSPPRESRCRSFPPGGSSLFATLVMCGLSREPFAEDPRCLAHSRCGWARGRRPRRFPPLPSAAARMVRPGAPLPDPACAFVLLARYAVLPLSRSGTSSLQSDVSLSEDELLSISGLQGITYWHSIAADTVRKRLEAYPLVRRARVEKLFPDTVRLTVWGRQPVALVLADVGGGRSPCSWTTKGWFSRSAPPAWSSTSPWCRAFPPGRHPSGSSCPAPMRRFLPSCATCARNPRPRGLLSEVRDRLAAGRRRPQGSYDLLIYLTSRRFPSRQRHDR